MLIGVPRALLYYHYGRCWERFLTLLGARTLLSPVTTKEIMDRGVAVAEDEACLPVKVFLGHVHYLRDKVDALFVPRVVSVRREEFACPKMLGLPDMVRSAVSDAPPLLGGTVDVDRYGDGGRAAALDVGRAVGAGTARTLWAWLLARRTAAPEAPSLPPGALRVLVLGHEYLLLDRCISLDILGMLARLGAGVITAADWRRRDWRRDVAVLPKKPFWTFNLPLVGGALYGAQPAAAVDGIINVMSFGCGTDSLTAEVMERRVRRDSTVPFMTVTVDEHTAAAGLQTRLEAFMDMLKRRRRHAGHFPAHG